jgi:translocation and assembly module TamA
MRGSTRLRGGLRRVVALALAVAAAVGPLGAALAQTDRRAGDPGAVDPASPATAPGTAAAAAEAPAAEPRRANPLAKLPYIGRFFGGGEEAASGDGSRVAPHYALEIDAPEPAARLVREHTLLGRWRQRPDYDPGQLDLFVRRAEPEIRELLAAEGWFTPQVLVERVVRGVRVAIDPGPRAQVAGSVLQFDGEVGSPEHADLLARVRRDWTMPDGAPMRSADWEAAKRGLLAGLREGGFLRARIEASEAVVEQERAVASLRVDVESGPRLRFGRIDIGGLQRYPADIVEGLATFRPGDPYDGRRLTELQTRLNGGGWFTTVNVRADTAVLERDASLEEVPIRVDVAEQLPRRWVLGGGFDTDRGLNLVAGWEHRNVAGRGIQTFNGIELDTQRQLAYTTWDTPQDLAGWRWQFGARVEHKDVSNDLVDAGTLFGSRSQRRGDIETATSLQYQYERQNVVFAPGDSVDYTNRAIVLGYSWTQRRLDSPIFPTQGYVVTGQISGASSALASASSFVRTYAFGYGIVPLRGTTGEDIGRFVVRGELGAVFADSRSGIPSANLFRTGGGKSVRGYTSQSLGVQVGEATLGGRYLMTASAEYQHLITRDLAAAVFYDLGNAADDRSALRPVAGYGVGARWRTPVGPLNVDLAWGEAVRAVRLHFSIGVAF